MPLFIGSESFAHHHKCQRQLIIKFAYFNISVLIIIQQMTHKIFDIMHLFSKVYKIETNYTPWHLTQGHKRFKILK